MKLGLGQMGMTTQDFWQCTPREFWNKLEGYYDRVQYEQQQEWVRQRYFACLLLNVQIEKNHQLEPKDLIEFEWEKAEKKPIELPTPEDIERIQKRDAWILKKINNG